MYNDFFGGTFWLFENMPLGGRGNIFNYSVVNAVYSATPMDHMSQYYKLPQMSALYYSFV